MIVGATTFVIIFSVLAVQLINASVLHPLKPNAEAIAALRPDIKTRINPPNRATIVSRGGAILAVSLPGVALFANPSQIRHPQRVFKRIDTIIPSLNKRRTIDRLENKRASFVWIKRQITSTQELAVNRLGIPGLHLLPEWIRHYPQGDLAAHILGGVTPSGRGISGVEKYFNKRLRTHPGKPLRLSIDLSVQAIVHRELERAVHDYDARGACGIVENMSGRIVAMVSLPDYNANDLHHAPHLALFDRCVSGAYEPGSVMKLMTMSMALQSGLFHYWDRVNTTHPLDVDGFAIRDYEPVHRWLALPAVLAYSSCIGTSRMAAIMGPTIQRAWLRKMGFFRASAIQMPGAQPGLWHPRRDWHLLTTLSVSYGVGIAAPPIVLVNAVDAVINGGILFKPTLIARSPRSRPRRGTRIMSEATSKTMRRLMREVVLSGTGTYARVHGYLVGGKTGTAQVVNPEGGYYNHLNNASFISVFPTPRPKYVVYALIVHPKPTRRMRKFSFGFTTGGFVAAPAVGRIIRRMGPLLGVRPILGRALATENRRFSLPLKPVPPRGSYPLGPDHPFPPGAFRYAYLLAHEKPPRHPDREAAAIALNRAELAVPNQKLSSNYGRHYRS